jgi:hypothetical protein
LFVHFFGIEAAKVGKRGGDGKKGTDGKGNDATRLQGEDAMATEVFRNAFNRCYTQLTRKKVQLTEYSYKPVTFSN